MLAKNLDNLFNFWSRHKKSRGSDIDESCETSFEFPTLPIFLFIAFLLLLSGTIPALAVQQRDMAPQATRRKANKRSAGSCQRIDKHAKELALNIVATQIESVRANNSDCATAPSLRKCYLRFHYWSECRSNGELHKLWLASDLSGPGLRHDDVVCDAVAMTLRVPRGEHHPLLTKNMAKNHVIKLEKQANEDIATTMLALTTTPCSSSSGETQIKLHRHCQPWLLKAA